jgi:hypothetical protein
MEVFDQDGLKRLGAAAREIDARAAPGPNPCSGAEMTGARDALARDSLGPPALWLSVRVFGALAVLVARFVGRASAGW